LHFNFLSRISDTECRVIAISGAVGLAAFLVIVAAVNYGNGSKYGMEKPPAACTVSNYIAWSEWSSPLGAVVMFFGAWAIFIGLEILLPRVWNISGLARTMFLIIGVGIAGGATVVGIDPDYGPSCSGHAVHCVASYVMMACMIAMCVFMALRPMAPGSLRVTAFLPCAVIVAAAAFIVRARFFGGTDRFTRYEFWFELIGLELVLVFFVVAAVARPKGV
jgi:hypothetical protein